MVFSSRRVRTRSRCEKRPPRRSSQRGGEISAMPISLTADGANRARRRKTAFCEVV